jgi:UPF0271 protein
MDDLENLIVYQVGALKTFAHANGTKLVHVKPHGELYNWAAVEPDVARAIARGIRRADPELVMVALTTSPGYVEAATSEGLSVAREAFADRVYMPDGTLQPRRIPNSVHQDPDVAAEQVITMVRDHKVKTANGDYIDLDAETICIHGDNPPAPQIAVAIRRELAKAGIEVRALKPTAR